MPTLYRSREPDAVILESFARNPLRTRQDASRLLQDLVTPLEQYASPGGARIQLAGHGVLYKTSGAELEGFSRRLWGMVPMAEGGGVVDWSRINAGLAAGTDPQHPEYWGGNFDDNDQRFVEMAAIGYGLIAQPEGFAALEPAAKERLLNWLSSINEKAIPPNNWHFFRLIVNRALEMHGRTPSAAADADSLAAVEGFWRGEGWYSDGQRPQLDYYVSFALHYYGLLLSAHPTPTTAPLVDVWRERARAFAADFELWFARDGGAIPFGRSMNYRFAQGAYWGALAYAGVEALPWGRIKNLWLSHLRWWQNRPIFDRDGVLSVGYGYPNLIMAESYNSAASPYWATKVFLPLALGDDHPFWQAEEIEAEAGTTHRVQKHPMMIVTRDDSHAWALSSGQTNIGFPKCIEKYAKFAYSSAFGFSVENTEVLAQSSVDSMLALSDDGQHFRVRERVTAQATFEDGLLCQWQPYDDVSITTWLAPLGRWHLRAHRITTGRKLVTREGGFAVAISDELGGNSIMPQLGQGTIHTEDGLSHIEDPTGQRQQQIFYALPNTNLIHKRGAVPQLLGTIEVGSVDCFTLVFAAKGDDAEAQSLERPDLEAAMARAREALAHAF